MRTVLTFIGAYLLTLLIALFIAIELADFFRSQEEFIAVLLAQVLFSLIALVTFALAYRFAGHVRALGLAAIGLGLAAVLLEELPALGEMVATRSTDPYTLGTAHDLAITAELLVPAFVLVLIEWRLLRRRWLAARKLDTASTWPWVTMSVAGLVLCNRLTFEIVSSAVRQAPDDMLATFWLKVSIAVAALVIGIGIMERNMRRRRLARRAAQNVAA